MVSICQFQTWLKLVRNSIPHKQTFCEVFKNICMYVYMIGIKCKKLAKITVMSKSKHFLCIYCSKVNVYIIVV